MGLITYNELHRVLNYSKSTGLFIWKINAANNVKKGDIAGTKKIGDYVSIWINKQRYQAHVLAWFYEKGYWPENIIDHIDRIKDHNWFSNLREVSHSCNLRNTGNSKDNTSGIKN